MGFSKLFLVVLLCAGTIPAGSVANATGCVIDGVELKCGEASDAQSVAKAFASQQTAESLSKPINKLNLFSKPIDLELFRKSVERHWRKVRKAELQQRRKMHRRKISGTEFEEWAKTYDRAAANYDEAINFYRTLVWHGKNGKSAPEDTDS